MTSHLDRINLPKLFKLILWPERSFYFTAMVYGLGISLLSLATPISVQMLINTVATTGLPTPLTVIASTLFALLMLSGILKVLRIYVMEIFTRRFYARMVSEISLRSLYARNPFFHEDNKAALFNRYFDIVTVQKEMPKLLIGGFTILLEAVVGSILVSLYHPLFLVFNIGLVFITWLTWFFFGRNAVDASIGLSHRKHEAAAWIEGLGASNGFYKSEKNVIHALQGAEQVTSKYIEQDIRYFRYYFIQMICFITIYALASASLLGLGGWLVIKGELSLGQLVAAELVLSVVFYGVSQLGGYLKSFYDLCAAVEELSLFYEVEQEELTGDNLPSKEHSSIRFVDVRAKIRGKDIKLNFTVDSGSVMVAHASSHRVQHFVFLLLERHLHQSNGYVSIGGIDIREIEPHQLRQQVIVLAHPTVINATIGDYLRLSADQVSAEEMMLALHTVGLEPVVAELENGLDTRMVASGWPLSVAETIQLQLAHAILAKPRLLVLSQLFDMLPEDRLKAALNLLHSKTETTVMYFCNRRVDLGYDHFLYLENQHQRTFDCFNNFQKYVEDRDRLMLKRGTNEVSALNLDEED